MYWLWMINNADGASVACIAEANPSSNINIESLKGDYIFEVSHSNNIPYTLQYASYKNAG